MVGGGEGSGGGGTGKDSSGGETGCRNGGSGGDNGRNASSDGKWGGGVADPLAAVAAGVCWACGWGSVLDWLLLILSPDPGPQEPALTLPFALKGNKLDVVVRRLRPPGCLQRQ